MNVGFFFPTGIDHAKLLVIREYLRFQTMATGEFRVFISAVTSEFGKARSAISADLQAKDLRVRVQDYFRQEADADTLLKKLYDYIRDCTKVVCIIGKRSGACPKPEEAEPFAYILPNGVTEASYTQWEYYFARHFDRRRSIHIANDDYEPDEKAPKGSDYPDLQSALVRSLKEKGRDRNYFSNSEELRLNVLKENWERPEHLKPSGPKPSKPILLPYPSIGALFKGRENFLSQLRKSLTRGGGGKTAIFNAVYGLGGIGKSRAAVEYAWAHQDYYSALLFVIGDTPETLRRNLAGLSATLVPELETTDETAHVAAVLDWLKANPGWLLILDNLDNKEVLAEAERLMAGITGGHVIITSRLSNFPAEVEPLGLEVLGEDAALAFLIERTKGRRRTASDDEETAREIAGEVGNLALMLEQAGAYIAERRMTFTQYLQQWRTNQGKVMAWSDPTVTHYPNTVAITWLTSVNQLTPAGRRLLERLAWLAPEPIPDFLLDVPCPGEDENLHDALADLAAYSLVTRDAEGPFFLVHRLVQDVTRRSFEETVRTHSLGEALNWIDDSITGDPRDFRNWSRLDLLIPHAETVASHADLAGIPLPTVRLMNEVAIILLAKGLYNEAEPLKRRALAIAEKTFGTENPILATALDNLANLLVKTDRPTEAEPLMRRALAIDEKCLAPDHADVATRLNNLASLLQDTNRLTEAEPLIRRALAIDEKNFGPDHPTVAIRLNNLAHLLTSTDRLDEAEPIIRRALAIDEKKFGPDYPTVAIRLNNLAELLARTNRPVEAEPLARRVITIFVDFKHKTGRQHPHFKAAISNYAGLLKATGKNHAEIKAALDAVIDGSV